MYENAEHLKGIHDGHDFRAGECSLCQMLLSDWQEIREISPLPLGCDEYREGGLDLAKTTLAATPNAEDKINRLVEQMDSA